MPLTPRRRAHVPTLLALLAVLIALFPTGQSVAAGLSKGKVKKIATKTATSVATTVSGSEITKRAPGLSVGDSAKLGGVPASGYARNGTYSVAVAPGAWLPVAAVGDTMIRSLNTTSVSYGNPGPRGYTLAIPVPSAANGVKLRMTKVRYCVSPEAGTRLSREVLRAYRFTNGSGVALGTGVDNTIAVTTAGCRVITTDQVLGPQDAVTFSVTLADDDSGPGGSLGAVTAQFEPTDVAADPIS